MAVLKYKDEDGFWQELQVGINVEVTGSGNAITDASISGRTITLTKGATYALTTDIPDTSNLSSFSVEVWQ